MFLIIFLFIHDYVTGISVPFITFNMVQCVNINFCKLYNFLCHKNEATSSARLDHALYVKGARHKTSCNNYLCGNINLHCVNNL